MGFNRVEIGRKVDYQTLEKALVDAAEEIGLNADVKDRFKHDYVLGSLKKVKRYDGTEVGISGRFFTEFVITIKNKNPIDYFHIHNVRN